MATGQPTLRGGTRDQSRAWGWSASAQGGGANGARGRAPQLLSWLGGRKVEDETADGHDDARTDLQEAVLERGDLGSRELGPPQSETKLLEEGVGRRRAEDAELVPEEARAARAVELEPVVELLYSVLAVAATAEDSRRKRKIADCLFSNLVWDGVTLVPKWRKPFGLVAERLSLTSNRGGGIRTRDLHVPNVRLYH